jgi:uncharacterized protein with NRDE domain
MMCLLIALSRTVDGAPLVIGANRDELYGRPATAMTVLRDSGPRLLGGLDHQAGGTWLAVSEHGVVAGLTNQPVTSGPRRDPSRRSRGELPLMFAAYPDAATAVEKVCAGLDPEAYNPCWLLVGDRRALFSVGLAGGTEPLVRELPPGQYVLENVPPDPPSGKAARIGADLAGRLAVAREAEEIGVAGAAGANGAVDALERVLIGNGVHLEEHQYGTRSSLIVTVPWAGLPELLLADGPPARTPFTDVIAGGLVSW